MFLIEKGSIRDTPDNDVGIRLDTINDRHSDGRIDFLSPQCYRL
jgi:hypothetical protein